jgi:SAM-dependent methyltransferase
MRALGKMLGLQRLPLFQWPVKKSIAILESSARGPYPAMLREKFDYYPTEYDPERIAEGTDPRSVADFQDLHFNDASFDIVIASDVFEHVRRDEDGFREILRVLKPEGSMILTVPYEHSRLSTIRRIDTSGERDVHHLEPEYHGGGGHTLTYRNYGRDLLSLLHRTGYAVCRQELNIPALGISCQSVFIGRKGDYSEVLDLDLPGAPMESLGPLVLHRLFLLYKFNLKGLVHYWNEMKRK